MNQSIQCLDSIITSFLNFFSNCKHVLIKINVLDNLGKVAVGCKTGVNANLVIQNATQNNLTAKHTADQVAFYTLSVIYQLTVKAPVAEICNSLNRLAAIAWSLESIANGCPIASETFCKSDIEFTVDHNGSVTYQRYINNKADGASVSWVSSVNFSKDL